jgi:hypothetical protein
MGIPRTSAFEPRTVANILDGMRATIRLPHEWSHRTGSRTADSIPCDPCSPAARSWCLTGTLDRQLGQISDPVLREQLGNEAEELLLTTARRVLNLPGLHSLQQFNDDRSTTHEDVLDLLSEARATLPMRADYVPAPALVLYLSKSSLSANA